MAVFHCGNAATRTFSFKFHCQEPSAAAAAASAMRRCQNEFAGSRIRWIEWRFRTTKHGGAVVLRARGGGEDSYLSMWKRAQERQQRERLEQEAREREAAETQVAAERKRREEQFSRILEVPQEERDRVQRLEVVDRAAAALAAAEALLASKPSSFSVKTTLGNPENGAALKTTISQNASESWSLSGGELQKDGNKADTLLGSAGSSSPVISQHSPGPDFWTWSPPLPDKPEDGNDIPSREVRMSPAPTSKPVMSLLELDYPQESLNIEYESRTTAASSLPLIFQSSARPSLPPLQSLLEIEKETASQLEPSSLGEILPVVPDFKIAAASAAELENHSKQEAASGVNLDGSRWWRETGIDHRENGVTCNWTVTRGVSTDGAVEWEEKFWEASDQFDYKELGAEKSGRDAFGNVWREFWQEAMWQDSQTGLLHIEKSADKWGVNGVGGQWHEKWWEHYDASGRAEKWADKWSRIDCNTILEPGHAHVWHERWGEEFDGRGRCMKYSDKWAERAEHGGSWTKWGDKWDEKFYEDTKGVKQGETWWEGGNGERWNRTWGEEHNATGWVHKYGKSSSGEHWDCHVQQDTWYEKAPHFGFKECVENSQELQRVGKKKKNKL